MDCKVVLISVLVFVCVKADSFSYNQGNRNQAIWSGNQQINNNLYQTGYSAKQKESITQSGYNSQWNQGYNVAQNSQVLPSSGAKNLAAGQWNNEGSNQPLQIVGKPYQTQGYTYPTGNYGQGYANYQPVTVVGSGGYNGVPQNVGPPKTNQYNPKLSRGDYIPWPVSETNSQVLGLNTPAKYSTQPIVPVVPVPVNNLNPEYGPVYKDQDTIVPTQSPVTEQPIYDKPFIIIHENGTYENVDNLDNIKWDENNRAHLITKEPPNVIIAIIEIEGVAKPETATTLEVPYDTGITKIPQVPINPSVPSIQSYTNPIAQTTTENALKYFQPENLMPIQNTAGNSINTIPYSSQPNLQTNEEQLKNTKDSPPLYTPQNYGNNVIQPQYPNTVNTYAPQNNYYAGTTPNQNVNYTWPNTNNNLPSNSPGAINYSPTYKRHQPNTPNTETYKPYTSYPAINNSQIYNAANSIPNGVRYQPSIYPSYGITDSKPNVVTDKPQQTNGDSTPDNSNNKPSMAIFNPTYRVSKRYIPNIETYKPYVGYNASINSPSYTNDFKPNTVTDKPVDTVIYKPQQDNSARKPLISSNTPSYMTYAPLYGGYTPYIPSTATYNSYPAKADSPTYTGTESTPSIETYKPYVGYNTATNKPQIYDIDSKPDIVTNRPQEANAGKVSYTTENTPYTVTYSPYYVESDSTPTITSNTPYSVREEPTNDNSNDYDSATNNPTENNNTVQSTTEYNTYAYTTPSTDTNENTESVGNDNTESTKSQTPTTTSKSDVVQPSSENEFGQEPVDEKEPNTNYQDYDINDSSNPSSDLFTSPEKQTWRQNGYNRPRYYKPNINNYNYRTKKPFNAPSYGSQFNYPQTGFYNRPSYYKPGQNTDTYDVNGPLDSTSDLSTSDGYEPQNKPQDNFYDSTNSNYAPNEANNNYPVTDSSDQQSYPQNNYNKPASYDSNPSYDDVTESQPQATSIKPETQTGIENKNPEYYSTTPGTNDDYSDKRQTTTPSDDLRDVTDLQDGKNRNWPEDYDTYPNTNNDGFNDDDVNATTNQPTSSNVFSNGTGPQNGYDTDRPGGSDTDSNNASYNEPISQNDDGYDQPAYYSSTPNTNDGVADTSNSQPDVSDTAVAPREENKSPIDYALHIREPPRLRSDLEIDPSELKKTVDKPVVWFRKDASFWDKVTKGSGAYDSLSVYNINCKPMLIERMTTVHHYANGTKVVEYVDSIWDSPDAPNPREITAKRVFREDGDE